MAEVGREVARRLQATRERAVFLIPTAGYDSYAVAGEPFHDPDADAAFVTELRKGAPSCIEHRGARSRHQRSGFRHRGGRNADQSHAAEVGGGLTLAVRYPSERMPRAASRRNRSRSRPCDDRRRQRHRRQVHRARRRRPDRRLQHRLLPHAGLWLASRHAADRRCQRTGVPNRRAGGVAAGARRRRSSPASTASIRSATWAASWRICAGSA